VPTAGSRGIIEWTPSVSTQKNGTAENAMSSNAARRLGTITGTGMGIDAYSRAARLGSGSDEDSAFCTAGTNEKYAVH